jgi:hypothetical protein
MSTWHKLMAVGLVSCAAALGCTVTSSDDEAEGGAGGDEATGGTSNTGGSGGATGGSAGSATGGSGGVAPIVDCGLDNADNACANGLRTSCCEVVGVCRTDATCLAELDAIQTCSIALLDPTDTADVVTNTEFETCVADNTATGLPSEILNDVLICLYDNPTVSYSCTGYEPIS